MRAALAMTVTLACVRGPASLVAMTGSRYLTVDNGEKHDSAGLKLQSVAIRR